MKILIKYGLISLILIFTITLSGFLYFKGGAYIVSFLLPTWNPPSVTVFPSHISIKTKDCEVSVPVVIEGKTYNFLLDTDRPFSLGVLEKLDFKKQKFELLKEVFGFGLVETLKIGKMEFHQVRLPLLGNKEYKGFKLNTVPEGYDGVLGNDFIFNVNMGISLKQKKIHIRKPLERPRDRKFSEIKLKTDIIPLLPRASVNFLGKEVVLQLKNLKKDSTISIEDKTYSKILESAPKEDLDPTAALIGKETLDGVQKKDVNFLEANSGAQGELGCGIFKSFQEVGLDYKSGNLFVVR